jgi:predicted secreted protein
MFKRIAVVLAVALAAVLPRQAAQSADALALKILGFSPDGRYFAFMQYGPQWEAERFFAETFVIDASRDRFVHGAPVRVTAAMKDVTSEDNVEPVLKAFVANAAKRSAGVLNPHKVSKPGALLVRVDEAQSGKHGSGSDQPKAGAPTVTAKHPQLGDLKLTLDPKQIDWPKSSKLGDHKGAALCAGELDGTKGAGFRLTLAQGSRTIVLNDDQTIPASRRCVTGYGFAEVHAFDRPDGKVTLAVILGMQTRGFEGEDRVFLAVTRVLDH